MTASALYRGHVMHRRLSPRQHRFRYSAFWLLLDLDELGDLTRRLRLFSHNRFNLFSLHDADHGDGSVTPLKAQIEGLLYRNGIDAENTRVRLLCMPRMFGYSFNPLSIYFCDTESGTPRAIVYQVHNTFGERHAYVLPVAETAGPIRQACDKNFFVSPFLDMDMQYRFAVSRTDRKLSVGITALHAGKTILTACLRGNSVRLDDAALRAQFLHTPAVCIKVIAAIHFEALRLWLKGLRLRPRVPSVAEAAVCESTPAKVSSK